MRSMNHPNLLPILTCFLAAKPSTSQPGTPSGASSRQASEDAEAEQLPGSSFATRDGSRADDTAFASPERLASNAQVLLLACYPDL